MSTEITDECRAVAFLCEEEPTPTTPEDHEASAIADLWIYDDHYMIIQFPTDDGGQLDLVWFNGDQVERLELPENSPFRIKQPDPEYDYVDTGPNTLPDLCAVAYDHAQKRYGDKEWTPQYYGKDLDKIARMRSEWERKPHVI